MSDLYRIPSKGKFDLYCGASAVLPRISAGCPQCESSGPVDGFLHFQSRLILGQRPIHRFYIHQILRFPLALLAKGVYTL